MYFPTRVVLLAGLLIGISTIVSAQGGKSDLGRLLDQGEDLYGRDQKAAIAVFKRGLRRAELTSDLQYQATFANRLAACLSSDYRFKEARPYAQRALAIAQRMGRDDLAAISLMELCTVDGHSGGDTRKAGKECRESYEIFRRLGSEQDAAIALSRLAVVQIDIGAYRAALNTLDPLLQGAYDAHAQHVYLQYLGKLFLLLGQYEKAASYLEKAIRDMPSEGVDCGTYANQGEALLGLHRDDKAAWAFQTALTLCGGTPYHQDAVRMSVGKMFLERQDPRAYEIMAPVQRPLHRARLELLKKRFAASQKHFKEAAQDSVTISDSIAAYAGLGQASEGLGDKVAAQRGFMLACAKIEATRDGLPTEYQDSYMAGADSGFVRSEVCAAYRRY
ncbi:MAG: hypothetical protein PHU21_02665 [Elusimicrobia bacterium]|nr:hypothetical protein [Elusimicrobiota bacterium]